MDSPTNLPAPEHLEPLFSVKFLLASGIQGKFVGQVEFVSPGRLEAVIIVGQEVSRPL